MGRVEIFPEVRHGGRTYQAEEAYGLLAVVQKALYADAKVVKKEAAAELRAWRRRPDYDRTPRRHSELEIYRSRGIDVWVSLNVAHNAAEYGRGPVGPYDRSPGMHIMARVIGLAPKGGNLG